GGSSEKYLLSFVSSSNCFFAAARSSAEVNKSRIDAAIAFAPTTAPLWAIDIVGVILAVQWCACPPGTTTGNRRVPVGTTQVTSPISFEDLFCLAAWSGFTFVGRPISFLPRDFCNSLANLFSSSVISAFLPSRYSSAPPQQSLCCPATATRHRRVPSPSLF